MSTNPMRGMDPLESVLQGSAVNLDPIITTTTGTTTIILPAIGANHTTIGKYTQLILSCFSLVNV